MDHTAPQSFREKLKLTNHKLQEKRAQLSQLLEVEPPANCLFHWGWEHQKELLEGEIEELMEAMFLMWKERIASLK